MKRESLKRLMEGSSGPRNQVAALCWRLHKGRVEVLLVTSRDTGRWVLPKGWPVDGRTAGGSAEVEAWEEAGVRGTARPEALGYFSYDKVMTPDTALPCLVSVHALEVEGVERRFPERKQRRRKWFEASRAARKVAEPELRDLLERIAADPDAIHGETGTDAGS